MILIDNDAIQSSDKKYIRFPNLNENYRPMFLLEDGKNLVLHDAHYNETKSVRCAYLDPHHFNYGTTCFHIDQFAEVMRWNGHTYEPETFVTDLSVYQRYYADRELKDDTGKLIPYRVLVGKGDQDRFLKPEFVLAFCPEAEEDRQFAVIHNSSNVNVLPTKRFCSAENLTQELSDFNGVIAFPALPPDPRYCKVSFKDYEQRFVAAVIQAHQRERAPGLDAQINAAKVRTDAGTISGHSREAHTL